MNADGSLARAPDEFGAESAPAFASPVRELDALGCSRPTPLFALAAQQAQTASNYSGGAATRVLCGGLENQIEHHLFPHMPRSHPRRAACRTWSAPFPRRSAA